MELLTQLATFRYIDVDGQQKELDIAAESLAYTFCQVPIVLRTSREAQIVVQFNDGNEEIISGNTLDADLSQHIFSRDGVIRQLTVFCDCNPTQ